MWLFWRKITKLTLDITYQHSNNNLNEITRLPTVQSNLCQMGRRAYHTEFLVIVNSFGRLHSSSFDILFLSPLEKCTRRKN